MKLNKIIQFFNRAINIERERSIAKLTFVGFILGLSSLIFFFSYGFLRLYDINVNNIKNMILSFIECGFAFIGLFFIKSYEKDLGNSENKIKYFQKENPYSFIWIIIIILGSAIINISLGVNQSTFSNIEFDLAIILSGPAEELFFRGFILHSFKRINKYEHLEVQLYNNKKISLIAIFGILLSAFLFADIHINYYNKINALLTIFLGGVLLGFIFWITEDLTACILSHTIINLLALKEPFFGIIAFIAIITLGIYFIKKLTENHS